MCFLFVSTKVLHSFSHMDAVWNLMFQCTFNKTTNLSPLTLFFGSLEVIQRPKGKRKVFQLFQFLLKVRNVVLDYHV